MSYGSYPDLSSVNRVLVIKLRHLGDVLLTSPLFTLLKERLPHAEIDAYLYEESIPMLEGHPAISSFHGYPRGWKKLPLWKRLVREGKLMLSMRKKKYDMVINLTEGDRGAIVAWISGARFRVGMDPQGSGLKGKKKLYTHLIKHYGAPRHTVEKNLDALRRIGIFPQEERKLFFYVPDAAKIEMEKRLKEKNIAKGSYLLIHPASRWLYKSWPSSCFQQLILQLLEKKMPVALCGGVDGLEKEFVERIKEGIYSPLLCDFSGQTTLKEMGALIEMSRLLLCVDSVSLHIASALLAKTLVLFGPTSEILWGPWRNPNAKILSLPYSCRPCCLDGCAGAKMADCLFSLPVERVHEAIIEMIR